MLQAGLREVKRLLLASALKSRLLRRGAGAPVFPRRAFWHHSVAVGVLCRILSQKAEIEDADTAYVAGLIARRAHTGGSNGD